MLTIPAIPAIPASEPVLVGTLGMHRLGRIKGRPVLTCQAWCAWCKVIRHHEQALRRWETERRPARQFAEARGWSGGTCVFSGKVGLVT